jgi:hypothetical protein
MDGDVEDKDRVLVMNRPKPRVNDVLPSPGELAEWDDPLYGLRKDRRGDDHLAPEAQPVEPEAEYQPPPKKSDPLPKPGDPYRACARFLNRLSVEPRLIHFVDKDCWAEAFAYSDLRRVRWIPADDPAGGPVLVLRFIEAVITDVYVEGQKLEDIHHWISEGVMPWIWEQPSGFKARNDNAVVITRITFRKVER